MEFAALILAAVSVILAVVILIRTSRSPRVEETEKMVHALENKIEQDLSQTAATTGSTLQAIGQADLAAIQNFGNALQFSQQAAARQQEQQLKALEEKNALLLKGQKEQMDRLQESVDRQLREIRSTVDEKLQATLEKRIGESFKAVSDQLEQVYKGLGEMQTLAADVGGLKKVLSGVKTRGIMGEVQLGAILEEILSPEQYATDVATIPGSTERVEFAVKLPGRDGTSVYLPIDSKFPGERYTQLLDARETGDKARIEAACKALDAVIRSEARDIRTKYVAVPYTTNFGILFLPFESLYAEVVSRGLIEPLQREYQINIAGPSTMAALLNSLQMGFRTLAIQQRSGEVWEVLGAVKTEFEKFGQVMQKMQTHLTQTSGDLELLMGTRSRAIRRKLSQVQQLSDPDAAALLFPEDE